MLLLAGFAITHITVLRRSTEAAENHPATRLRSPIPVHHPVHANHAPIAPQQQQQLNENAPSPTGESRQLAALREENEYLRSTVAQLQLQLESMLNAGTQQEGASVPPLHPGGAAPFDPPGQQHASTAGNTSTRPATLDTLPSLPSPLPPLLSAFRAGRLDWHDVVSPAKPPSNPEHAALVKAEHDTVELLQGYGHAYTGNRGPWEKHLACPYLKDRCMVHPSARECAEDDLCGWCAPRGLCVDVRKVWRDTPVRGRADPVCPEGLLVSAEAHESLLAGTPAATEQQAPLSYNVHALGKGVVGSRPFDPTARRGGVDCDVVVHRYRPSRHSYRGNTVMSYHFLFEYWQAQFPKLLKSGDSTFHDPRVHIWYPAGAPTHFWEFLVTATDACHRSLGDDAATGVCYRASPLPMDAPLKLVALPPPEKLSEIWKLRVPFDGIGDWADSAIGSVLAPTPVGSNTAPSKILESELEASELGRLPRDTDLKAAGSAEQTFVKILQLDKLHESLTRPVLTLISRRNKRVLLNEHQLVAVAERLGMEVQIVALERMPLYDQIKALRRTTVLAGIHGSGLSNAMFLPKGSAMIQLMPHGVQRGAAFFSKPAALAEAQYLEWTNPSADASAVHWEFMGADMQGKAENMLQRGDACCGDNVFFSFWINQDTRVEPKAWEDLLGKALKSPLNAKIAAGVNTLGR